MFDNTAKSPAALEVYICSVPPSFTKGTKSSHELGLQQATNEAAVYIWKIQLRVRIVAVFLVLAVNQHCLLSSCPVSALRTNW